MIHIVSSTSELNHLTDKLGTNFYPNSICIMTDDTVKIMKTIHVKLFLLEIDITKYWLRRKYNNKEI